MKFESREQKIIWLQKCAKKIAQLEGERFSSVMSKDFNRAYSTLLAIKFAKNEFKKVSLTLKNNFYGKRK